MVDVFFQVMLDIYQKIDKVNENGRQLMRLDVIELSKQIESLGIPTHSSIQKGYLDSYLSYWFFRDPKDLEKNIASAQVPHTLTAGELPDPRLEEPDKHLDVLRLDVKQVEARHAASSRPETS